MIIQLINHKKVIYAFGVKHNGQNLCNFGDLSVLSFHATKVFNTMEGGGIVYPDAVTKKRIDFLKNFGFANETTIMAPGINSKMNKMQAALGLVQLKNYKGNIEKRKIMSEAYRKELTGIKGITFLPISENTQSNFAYFPIFVDEKEYGISRDQLYEKLKQNRIFGRRCFCPLISKFSMYKSLDSSSLENLKTAVKIADQVICLPIYPTLNFEYILAIAQIIRYSQL